MKRQILIVVVLALATTSCNAFKNAPGRPSLDSQTVQPSEIMNFDVLYGQNCAGCHGSDGRGGAAIGIGDPVYLAIADNATISRVSAEGVPGTAMPAFAESFGGMLTAKQIDAIVSGMRERWSKANILAGLNPPPYRPQAPGDAGRGGGVYTFYCSSCHGTDGRGGPKASSIVDSSYLALVSDQGLRTTVIVGRPELGAPDWRGNVPNQPMSSQDVSDVVAWLAAQRTQFPNQLTEARNAPQEHVNELVGRNFKARHVPEARHSF